MDNDELIEKYLQDEMTPSERVEFEKMLNTDKSFAEKVEVERKIVEGIRLYGKDVELMNSFKDRYEQEKPRSLTRPLFFLRIAAVAVLLIAATWFLIFYFGQKKKESEEYVAGEKKKTQIPFVKSLKDSINKNLIAENRNEENFRKLARFEELIGQGYRSEGEITVVSPKINRKYKVKDTVSFSWQKPGSNQLKLVIFNNKGNVISEQEIPKGFTYKKVLLPGLYYWQLETKSEAVYVGKFLVE
jgi:hypothetical protein